MVRISIWRHLRVQLTKLIKSLDKTLAQKGCTLGASFVWEAHDLTLLLLRITKLVCQVICPRVFMSREHVRTMLLSHCSVFVCRADSSENLTLHLPQSVLSEFDTSPTSQGSQRTAPSVLLTVFTAHVIQVGGYSGLYVPALHGAAMWNYLGI